MALMKIVNKTKVPQEFNGRSIPPGKAIIAEVSDPKAVPSKFSVEDAKLIKPSKCVANVTIDGGGPVSSPAPPQEFKASEPEKPRKAKYSSVDHGVEV